MRNFGTGLDVMVAALSARAIAAAAEAKRPESEWLDEEHDHPPNPNTSRQVRRYLERRKSKRARRRANGKAE